MITYIMTQAENELAQIIWETEPVQSGQLVKLASQRLGWNTPEEREKTILKKTITVRFRSLSRHSCSIKSSTARSLKNLNN